MWITIVNTDFFYVYKKKNTVDKLVTNLNTYPQYPHTNNFKKDIHRLFTGYYQQV